MATLCTEIGMPKYRENKKGMKELYSWQYSCQHLSQAMLGVCEGVSARYTACAILAYGCVLTSECEGIHIHVV